MSWQTVAASVVGTVASGCLLWLIGWLVRKVTALNGLPTEVATINTEVAALAERLTSELSGNSGGLRQAVDGLTAHLADLHLDVRELRKRMDHHLDKES